LAANTPIPYNPAGSRGVAWTTGQRLEEVEYSAPYPLHTGELAVLLDVGYSRANLGARTTFIETLFVGRAKGSPRLPGARMSSRGDRRSRFSAEPTVLIVDDEETPRSTTCRMVRALGYQARTARDGREALRYIQQHPGEIRLVLTDVVMPYMDGGELAERARDLHPRLPIILMSAYPVGEIAELVAAYPELPFLEKPFTTETLHKFLTPILGPPTPRGRRANDRVRYRDRARQSS
jgi:CheY-like chemotaxis protein